MADNMCGMTLHSHRYAAESDGNGPGRANPSVAAELEVIGPGADRNPLDSVAAGNLPRVSGILPQMNEVSGNEMDEAAAQASSLGSRNGAMVDNNQLATSTHHSVQQEEMNDSSNSQLRFFVKADGSLLDPFRVPPTAQGSGAGDANGDENESLEGEVDSDLDDYSQFTSAEVLDRLHAYKMAYRSARQQQHVAEVRVANFIDKYGILQHARDTQDDYVCVAQEECDAIKRNADTFQTRTEVVHQSKILEFNE